MVSRDEARSAFGRAFSRPPRLLFGNPVALIFSVYYAYVYGIIYGTLLTSSKLTSSISRLGTAPLWPSAIHLPWLILLRLATEYDIPVISRHSCRIRPGSSDSRNGTR